ncbi:hypothetical protein TNIN_426701 [Trichonephila inaurata madagascariensis]|uniref:Uncharacterized protein n=1 Tax=Trichonephila inaurata madagascariensis TaxID=2747483 RepID=A0A8X6K8W1_9ARAC|nr:hypothetical protein TNIN_426701 [Trichonephila inaurata madagascariensis]
MSVLTFPNGFCLAAERRVSGHSHEDPRRLLPFEKLTISCCADVQPKQCISIDTLFVYTPYQPPPETELWF